MNTTTAPLDSSLARLAMGMALNQGFGLHILVCNDPIRAGAATRQIIDHITELTGSPPVIERLDPYHAVGHGAAAPISFESLANTILAPLVGQGSNVAATEPGKKRIVIIDGSWAPERDTLAWCQLFGRMNLLRNRIIRETPADLLMVLTPVLDRELAGEASDMWSLRTTTARVTVPESELWFAGESHTAQWTRDELIGRLEQLRPRQFINVLDRVRLPLDVRSRGQSRTAQAIYVVDALAEQGRLGELAAVLGIKPRARLARDLHILHLTGLHIGKRTWQDRRTSMRDLLEVLQSWQAPVAAAITADELAASAAIDLICISGNLADSGQAEEYELFIREILEPLVAGLGLTRDRVFWAPGNHDVVRHAMDAEADTGLRQTLDTPAAIDNLLGDPRQRHHAFAHMRPYAEATRGYLGELLRDRDPAFATARLCHVDDVRVGVACLNSAWRSGAGNGSVWPVWIGRRQFLKARRGVAGADLRIALVHHPFSALHPDERYVAEQWCRREFDLVLHAPVDATSEYASLFPGGEVVAGVSFHTGDKGEYGFQLIRVRQSREIDHSEYHHKRFAPTVAYKEITRELGQHTPAYELLVNDDVAGATRSALDAIGAAESAVQRAALLAVLMIALERTLWDQTAHPIPQDQRADVLAAIEAAFDALRDADLPHELAQQIAGMEFQLALWVGPLERQKRIRKRIRKLGVRMDTRDLDLHAVLPPNRLKDASISAIDSALAALPADDHPWGRRLLRAELLFKAGHHDEAATELSLLSTEFPNRPLIDSRAAARLGELRGPDHALPHARRAFAGLPGTGQRILLALCLVESGDTAEAWRYIEPVLPSDEPWLLRVAAVAAESQEPQRALELWARYLQVKPEDATIRVRRAQRLAEAGRDDEAAEEAWRAATGPGNESLTPDLVFHCARLQSADSLDGENIRILYLAERMRQRFPDDAKAQRYIVFLYHQANPLHEILHETDQSMDSDDSVHVLGQTAREFANVIEDNYRAGLISLESMCKQRGSSIGEYLTRALQGHAFFALFEDIEPSQTITLPDREILVSALELLLLHELELLDTIVQMLGDSGCLLLFADDHTRLQWEELSLHHRERADAARRIAGIQARLDEWIAAGRVRVIPRPQPHIAVALSNDEEEPLHDRVIQATSWYQALRDHPERSLLSADSFIVSLAGKVLPHVLSKIFGWDEESFDSFQQALHELADQRLPFAGLACALAAEPAFVKRRLARLGVVRAVTAADLASWMRIGHESIRGELDGIERVAREPVHLFEEIANLHLALLYAEAIWRLWTEPAEHAAPADPWPATDDLLRRMQSLDAQQHGALEAFLFAVLHHAVANTHALSTRRPDGHHTLDPDSAGARLLRALHDWARNIPERQAAHDDALARIVLAIENSAAPAPPDPQTLLPLAIEWISLLEDQPETLRLDRGWLACLCIVSASWTSDTPLARFSMPLQASDGTLTGLDLEELLQGSARALEAGINEIVSNLPIPVSVPLEASLLRADISRVVEPATTWMMTACADDNVLYEALAALLDSPEEPELRRAYALRAASTPWRRMRMDPRSLLRWGTVFDLDDTLPGDLDALRALLGEPGPLERADAFEELDARTDPGGPWDDGQHGWTLAIRASELPGALAAFPLGVFLRASNRDQSMAKMLAKLDSAEWVPAGELARTVAFAYEVARDDAALRDELPGRLESVLAQLADPPAEGSLAAAEPELYRLCKQIVNRLAQAQSPVDTVPRRELLWLTHRLYPWLAHQLSALPPERRARAIDQLCQAARSHHEPRDAEDKAPDVLDPEGYGADKLDHRRLAMLNALAYVVHITGANDPDSPENSAPALPLDAVLTWASARVLATWAETPLTEYERALRRLGKSASTLWWNGPATVPDAALALLLLRDLCHFGQLSELARLSWIEQIPGSAEEPGAPPTALVELILRACSVCAPALTPAERMLLMRRLDSVWIATRHVTEVLAVLIALYAAGVDELSSDITRRMTRSIERPEIRDSFALYGQALIERMTEPAAIAAQLGHLLDAARARDIDEVPWLVSLIDSLQHTANMLDAETRQRAQQALRQLIQSRPSKSDPRLAASVHALSKDAQ